MTVIRENDVMVSVSDALQYIPTSSGRWAAATPWIRSAAARDAIAQILTNSRLCAEGHRPICQDTGIVVVFVKVARSRPHARVPGAENSREFRSRSNER